LTPARRRAIRFLIGLATVAAGVVVLHDVFGVGGPSLDAPVTNWVQANVFLVAGALCLLRVSCSERSRSPR
jgi:hypothetical protein